MGTPISESYLLKQIQKTTAQCLLAFMHDTGGYTDWVPGAWHGDKAGWLIDDTLWRTKSDWPPPFAMFTKDRHHGFKTNWSHHDHHHNEYIAMPNPRYGDGGQIWRGEVEQVHDMEVNVDGKSKVFTNFTDQDINIAYEEEVSLEHSDESHFDHSWSLDVTSTTSQEVGGSYMGVEAKATFEQSVGFGTEETSGKSSSDTQANSDTVSITETLPPGAVVQVLVYKHRLITRQPYSINAAFDFDFDLKWNHWSSNHGNGKYRGGQREISVQGVAGLLALIAGHDTDHPSFEGYHPCSRVRNGLNWIANPKNRWVKFSGVNEVEYENNVDYKLTQLHQDAIPKGIDVVDMSEENNKERYGA